MLRGGAHALYTQHKGKETNMPILGTILGIVVAIVLAAIVLMIVSRLNLGLKVSRFQGRGHCRRRHRGDCRCHCLVPGAA